MSKIKNEFLSTKQEIIEFVNEIRNTIGEDNEDEYNSIDISRTIYLEGTSGDSPETACFDLYIKNPQTHEFDGDETIALEDLSAEEIAEYCYKGYETLYKELYPSCSRTALTNLKPIPHHLKYRIAAIAKNDGFENVLHELYCHQLISQMTYSLIESDWMDLAEDGEEGNFEAQCYEALGILDDIILD